MYSRQGHIQDKRRKFQDYGIEVLSNTATLAEICRKYNVASSTVYKWREQFIQGGKAALAQNRNSDTRNKGIEDLKKIIGDQSLIA